MPATKARPLTVVQFWLLIVGLGVSGIAALVMLSQVAGPHGKCPGEQQTSHPGSASCYAAYQNQDRTGVVG